MGKFRKKFLRSVFGKIVDTCLKAALPANYKSKRHPVVNIDLLSWPLMNVYKR